MTTATTDGPTSAAARYVDLLWDAVLRGDEYSAVDITVDALRDGLDVESVLLDVIGAVQARVGSEWAANRISVAQEHAATAINDRVVGTLTLARDRPQPHPDGSPWPASTASGTRCPPGCWPRSSRCAGSPWTTSGRRYPPRT